MRACALNHEYPYSFSYPTSISLMAERGKVNPDLIILDSIIACGVPPSGGTEIPEETEQKLRN